MRDTACTWRSACRMHAQSSDGRCLKTPVTGRSLIMLRSVSLSAVPPKMPEMGMKATQYRELRAQLLIVIEPCSTQGPAALPNCTRRHPSNSGKGNLDSIRAFRQKNLVCTRKGLTFRTGAPRGGELNVEGAPATFTRGPMCPDVLSLIFDGPQPTERTEHIHVPCTYV